MNETQLGQQYPEQRPAITPDHVWAITGPTINAAFDEYAAPLMIQNVLEYYGVEALDHLEEGRREELKEDIARALLREEQFVKSVSGAVLEAMNQMPDATEYIVLFDLDETLARRSLADMTRHLVRPAIVPLIAALQGMDTRITFGLLTSRSQGYLEEELRDPNELKSLTPYLQPERVLSSREVRIREFTSKYLGDELGGGIAGGEAQKIAVCEELLKESDSLSVILVDDLHEFSKVGSDERFRVLALDATNGFWLDI